MSVKKINIKGIKKERSRSFLVLLYPDNTEHCIVLDKILSTYDMIYVEHNKDKDLGGKDKKSHWHIFLKFKNARWNTSICEDLGLEPRFIEVVKNEKSALEYLLHLNEETKHHYSFEELKGSSALKNKLKEYIKRNSLTSDEIFSEIVKVIYSSEITTYEELVTYCICNNYIKELRSTSYLLCRLVDENAKFNFNNQKNN